MEVFMALVNSVNTFFFFTSFPTSFGVLRLPKIFLLNMMRKMIMICSPNHCKPSGSTVCPTLWLATSPVPWKITEELSTQKSLFKRWLTYWGRKVLAADLKWMICSMRAWKSWRPILISEQYRTEFDDALNGRKNMMTIGLLVGRYFFSIGNSMICSDIWHKYHEWYFKIVIRNFTSR